MGDDRLDAEEVLGSRGRVRVLKCMAESGELNISEVARRTDLNHMSAQRHLEKLRDMGLLREKRFGRIRIFEANFKALTVKFERGRGVSVDWEYPDRV